ncbi:helix-turn-helix transcriptional regulator [Spirochaeta cellobiosiphila]|uniref:helix-turn-helix transcriptional regulator n=1 Tax=Spirochaeta cellobiosiphila TaxID=504483 RepID=UPI00040CAFAC|nr:LuxR C-terminal-related transcriptional regulator [Spirochaeta cellobiosiphila]
MQLLDLILQIISLSTGIGALITLISIYIHQKRATKIKWALLLLFSSTLNYLTGIILFLTKDSLDISHIALIQMITGLFCFFSALRFIDILDQHKYPFIQKISNYLFFLIVILNLLQYISYSSLSVLNLTMESLFMLCLWINLLTVQTSRTFINRIKYTGLWGFAIIIPSYRLQQLFDPIPLHVMDAIIYSFLTMSALSFSLIYLFSKRTNNVEKLSTSDIILRFGLTEREGEIFDLLVESYSYKDICKQLNISLATVKTHVSHLYQKTNVNNKSELKYLLTPRSN